MRIVLFLSMLFSLGLYAEEKASFEYGEINKGVYRSVISGLVGGDIAALRFGNIDDRQSGYCLCKSLSIVAIKLQILSSSKGIDAPSTVWINAEITKIRQGLKGRPELIQFTVGMLEKEILEMTNLGDDLMIRESIQFFKEQIKFLREL